MKNKWLVLLSVVFVAAQALGGEGAGVRGSGKTIEIDGRPRLRDLVDRTVCRYENAADYFSKQPGSKELLDALSEVHWYLADVYRREMKRLRICLTENLRQLPDSEWDGLSVWPPRDPAQVVRTEQIAIRLNQEIYLDEKKFLELPVASDRVDALIHETTHSLIPYPIFERSKKVESVTAAIRRNFDERLTVENLALHLEGNAVMLAPRASLLQGARSALKILFTPTESLQAKYLAYGAVGEQAWLSLVYGGDWVEVLSQLEKPMLDARNAVLSENVAELKALLEKGVPSDLGFFPSGNEAGLLSLLDYTSPATSEKVLNLLWGSTSGKYSDLGPKLTPMERAVRRMLLGELAVTDVHKLVARGVNPNVAIQYPVESNSFTRRFEWRTLLTAAIHFQNKVVFQALLEIPGIEASTYGEAMTEALSLNEPSYLDALLEQKDFPTKTVLASQRTPLAEVVSRGLTASAQKLLALGADPNERTSPGSLFKSALVRDPGLAYLLASSSTFNWNESVRGDLNSEVRASVKLVLYTLEKQDKERLTTLLSHFSMPTIEKVRARGIARYLRRPDLEALFQ